VGVKAARIISESLCGNNRQVGAPEAVTFGESFRVNLFEGFVVILDALVEGGQMRFSGTVDPADFGHGFAHKQTENEW